MNIDIDHLPPGGLRRFGNSLVAFKLFHADSGDGVGIIEQWLPYGDSPPRHVHHREDEVFHILEGTLRLVVGDEERIAAAGDTLLAPKGIPHSFRVESRAGAHFLTIVRGADFETMVLAASRPTELRDVPEAAPPPPEMIAELERLCSENHITLVGPPLS